MGRIGFLAAVFVAAALLSVPARAQGSGTESPGLWMPSFDVRLSAGFNYDMLRSPTDVDFTRPMGYFGVNIPIPVGGNLNNLLGEDWWDDKVFSEDMFRKPENFKPEAGFDQSSNYTVRVDVPMLGGVGSFAYTQNFFLNFSTLLGGASVINAYQDIGELYEDDGDGDLSGYISLRGALRLPLDISMGWETMTFGYAYRVDNNDDLVFALQLHRHLFSMSMRMRADIDILGHVNVVANDVTVGGATTNFSIDEEFLNFHSGICHGVGEGRYRAEAWTPSLGVKWRRFSLDSRIGLDVRARGSASGGFRVPKVVNIETGDVEVLDSFDGYADSISGNPLYVFELLSEDAGLISREIDSIDYQIASDRAFRWKMPQAHTLGFDIIPNRFSVSYTKLFGEINLKITDIVRTTKPELTENAPDWLGEEKDTLKVDLGVKVDHVLMLHLNYPSFFVNAGICGIEVRNGNKYAFEDVGLRLGDVSMLLPVLSGGVNLGTKLQLRLEADILPLPAIRSGVNYFF